MKRRKLLSLAVMTPLVALSQDIVPSMVPEIKYHYLFSKYGSIRGWSVVTVTENEIKKMIFEMVTSKMKDNRLITFGLLISKDENKIFTKKDKVNYFHMFSNEIDQYVDSVFKNANGINYTGPKFFLTNPKSVL